ncbi:hypothetical protein HDU96_005098, partial [Phlyctochytrium bullatum]
MAGTGHLAGRGGGARGRSPRGEGQELLDKGQARHGVRLPASKVGFDELEPKATPLKWAPGAGGVRMILENDLEEDEEAEPSLDVGGGGGSLAEQRSGGTGKRTPDGLGDVLERGPGAGKDTIDQVGGKQG